tara:strand:- start:616 stop:1278 length:663 start_codon:yes stop_codon:yes gene_type:complete
MWVWGSVFQATPGMEPWGSFLGGWINYNHILKNLPIFLSLLAFYLLPFLFIEYLNLGFKNFVSTYIKNFIIVLIILIFFMQINLLDYLGNHALGGGVILKVSYLIAKNNYFLLLIFCAIGASVLIRFFKEDIKNNLIMFLPLIIIYGFPRILYQEYMEPLILVIFFLGIKTDMHRMYFKNISLSNFILISYFAIYLIGSIYFKQFVFTSYEEWNTYLNAQ